MNKFFLGIFKFALLFIILSNGVHIVGAYEHSDKKSAADFLAISVEEKRIEKAKAMLPNVVNGLGHLGSKIISQLSKSKDIEALYTHAEKLGNRLWNESKKQIIEQRSFDDRSLYWQRLIVIRKVKQLNFEFEISNKQRKEIIERFETASRGINDLTFSQKEGAKKILVTGFDPFLLDRNISQSNPSGVTAMMLDGQTIEFNGQKAVVEAFMVPVRFADFDLGLIEDSLFPFYKNNSVNLIATISMGRKDFDLERFPGKRRSATAPDNLNIITGANNKNPLTPALNGQPLSGDEFVEFSLPIESMSKAKGEYRIIDNHKVTTLTGDLEPNQLKELSKEIAVSGSGGGYLSNEISYRSIRLKNKLKSSIPTGHIHTPRMQQFDKNVLKNIYRQIKSMLEHSLETI